ncbi:MAG TPA: restriction endonuclease subunit S [Gammaproteobacteria bacterium]|nr:restriction endonuclease subunit S [Gammaproteobacteria bacterium]
MGQIAPLRRRPVLLEADKVYREIGIRSFGKGVFHKAPTTGLEIGSKRVFAIEPGDLLFNIVFAWEGAIAVATEAEQGMIGSHRFLTCVADSTKADARFLSYWFTHTEGREQLLRASPGGAGRNRTLGVEKLAEIHVPLPPLDEQSRIVARIEELASKVEEARCLRSLASTELSSAFAATRRALFGEAPTRNWIPLGTHVAEIENGKSPATEGRVAEPYEWAVLKVGAVSFGSFDERENKALPPSFKPLERYEVRAGDFLMSRANTPELVGACAIVRETRPRLMLSDKIFRFKFQAGSSLSPEYLDHVLKSPALRRQIVSGATGTSPTMKNISKEKVRALLIPNTLPSEQKRIVAKLDALQTKSDAAKTLQSETAAELSAMLPAILDTAFKGEL